MIKFIAAILVAATGVLGMKSTLQAQTSLVKTPRLQVLEDGERMVQRAIHVDPLEGSARMVAVCHNNGDVRIGFVVEAAPEFGRPLPKIGIVSASGTERVFGAHAAKPDDATISFFALPTNMRMTQKRPTKFIKLIAQSRDFGVVLNFSAGRIEASFDGPTVGLTALYISALCGFDPLT